MGRHKQRGTGCLCHGYGSYGWHVNGPEATDEYHRSVEKWAQKQGYHRDFDTFGAKGYYGATGREFAVAMASPFSYFNYYTGEGGLRVPLIMSGKNLPKNVRSGSFCFFTDIAPTIYELVGLSTSANEGYAPITGKSMVPHMIDSTRSIYGKNEGVGLESGNSSAYFLNGYKIVKNNIPLGDNRWHLFYLLDDPAEVNDLASQKPERFQDMLSAYRDYEKAVGVIKMPEGYSAEGEVRKKSLVAMLKPGLPYVLALIIGMGGLVGFFMRRKRKRRRF